MPDIGWRAYSRFHRPTSSESRKRSSKETPMPLQLPYSAQDEKNADFSMGFYERSRKARSTRTPDYTKKGFRNARTSAQQKLT
jgi:hypothetical protein